jgi:predicted flap endonuclease-1-like 5' DNA nuclease
MPENPQAPPQQIPLGVPVAGATLADTPTVDPAATISLLQQQVFDLQAANTALRSQLVSLQEQDLRSREKIVALEQTTTTLRQQLGQLQVRAGREPDDFASAVGHSLDTLQARLSGLSNPLSDFAVREFSIDAKVSVNVTPLGTVEYRFIQPGEAVEATSVSNVKMTVVPVPRQTQAGTWSPVEFTPTAGVEEIRGIGRELRQQLNQQGIYTVGDLLHAGGRVRGTVELASVLHVDRYRVDEWLAHAQLLTIRDVDGRIAGVLYEIGVRSLAALADQDPAVLAVAFNAQVARTGRKRVAHVDAATVTPWVRAARNFLGRVPAEPAASTTGTAGTMSSTTDPGSGAVVSPPPPPSGSTGI